MYRADQEWIRVRIDERFRGVQPEFTQYLELRDRMADPEQALTGLEWLSHAAVCTALADAYTSAAELWDALHPTPPERCSIAYAYRETAKGYHAEASRAELYAELAPAGR